MTPTRWWRRRSLRTRLVAGFVLPLTAALLVGTVALAALFTSGRLRELDVETAREARVLGQLASTGQLPVPLPVPAGSTLSAQVVSGSGQVLAASAGASRLLPLVDDLAVGTDTVEQPTSVQVPLRVRVQRTQVAGRTAWVVVAAPLGDVRRATRALRLVLLVVVPLLVLAATVLARLLVGRALQPVERLRAAARGFVADAAHELRSPLASMQVQLDVARRHPDLMSATALVDDLAPEVERLAGLVDDLLLLAKAESGTAVRREAVDLTALAGVAGDPVVVTGDPESLQRMLRNLEDNARRHATRVEVAVHAVDGLAVLDVDDDGPGIPAVDRQRVFERWVRLDEGRARTEGGAGLGLALVREIVTSHGGAVEATSSPLGGARLRVRLPLAGRAEWA